MKTTRLPQTQPQSSAPRSRSRRLDVYLCGVAAAAVAALIPLLRERSEPASALLFGYSAPKLAMIAVIGSSLMLCLAATVLFSRQANPIGAWAERTLDRLSGFLREMTALFFFFTAGLITVALYWLPDAAPALTARLLPFGLWFAFICLWTTFFLRLPNPIRLDRTRLGLALAAFALIALLTVLGLPEIFRTRFGFQPDPFDFQPPGIALDWGQLVSALISAALVSWVFSLIARLRPDGSVENAFSGWLAFAAFLLIWGMAALVWISVPSDAVLKGSYFMEIAAPSGLPYPASDAAYFAVWAESMLAGLGMKNAVISRQLFVYGLSVLFRLSGDDFHQTIDLLTGFLALIPALGFLLTLRLAPERRAGFFAGVFVGALLLFREWKTLYMAPHFGVSSAKMFLSDLPMLLMFLLVMNAAVWAIQSTSASASFATPWAAVGAVVGLAVLVRSQSLVILPCLLLAVFLRRGESKRAKVNAVIGLLGALLLVLSPALIRSRLVTGAFALEDTSIHGYELTRRYSGDPNYEPTRITDESADEFARRMSADLRRFAMNRPAETLSFILNHWTKSLTESVLVLPLGIDPALTWRERTDPGYQDVTRRLREVSAGTVYALLGIAALGAAVSWKRGGWLIGASCALYLLSSALGRYSGWRFNLPADWFMILYLGLGLGSLPAISRRIFAAPNRTMPARHAAPSAPQPMHSPLIVPFIITLSVLIGAQPALSDWLKADALSPSPANLADARAFLMDAPIPASARAELEARLSESETFCSGAVLYPRYFYTNEGLTSANPWAAYRPRDFARLSFVILNRENCDVVIPIELESARLNHRAECLVGGWRDPSGVLIGDVAICRDGIWLVREP